MNRSARNFPNNTANFCDYLGAPVLTMPLTMTAWVRLSAVGTAVRVIMALKQVAAGDARHYYGMQMAANEFPEARSGGAASSSAASASRALVAGEWTHVAVVFVHSTLRICYVNGIPGTANTAAQSPTGLDQLTIGMERYSTSTKAYPWNGNIAWPSVYNDALWRGELSLLAEGKYPPEILSHKLAWFGDFDETQVLKDAVAKRNATVTGTTLVPGPFWLQRSIPRHRYARSIVVGGAGLVWRLAGGRTGRPLAGRGGLAA